MLSKYEVVRPNNDPIGFYDSFIEGRFDSLESRVSIPSTKWIIDCTESDYALAQRTAVTFVNVRIGETDTYAVLHFSILLAKKGITLSHEVRETLMEKIISRMAESASELKGQLQHNMSFATVLPLDYMYEELDSFIKNDLSTPLVGVYVIDSPVQRQGFIVRTKQGDIYFPIERIYPFKDLQDFLDGKKFDFLKYVLIFKENPKNIREVLDPRLNWDKGFTPNGIFAFQSDRINPHDVQEPVTVKYGIVDLPWRPLLEKMLEKQNK